MVSKEYIDFAQAIILRTSAAGIKWREIKQGVFEGEMVGEQGLGIRSMTMRYDDPVLYRHMELVIVTESNEQVTIESDSRTVSQKGAADPLAIGLYSVLYDLYLTIVDSISNLKKSKDAQVLTSLLSKMQTSRSEL